jgi:recombination protein RecT
MSEDVRSGGQLTLETPKSAVATQSAKPKTVVELLNSSAMKTQIQNALPNILPVERFVRSVLTAFRKTPKLLECDVNSVLGGVMLSAQLGLPVNTPEGYAYLIPYGKECQFQIGYQGYIELCYRSGIVKSIYAEVIHENDIYKIMRGTEPSILHELRDGERGKPVFYYVVVEMDNGAKVSCVMSKSDIDKHRAQYCRDKSQYSPWNTAFDMMAKKTVVKQIVKTLPKSTEKAMQVFENLSDNAVGKYDIANGIVDTIESAEAEVIEE